MKARIVIPLFIALLGIGATIAASAGFRADARKNWESSADQTSIWLSSTLVGWVEESYAPLSGLAALIENSNVVSENEFHSALEGLEDRSSVFFLDAAGLYRFDEKWPHNPWMLTYSMGSIGASQADLSEQRNRTLRETINVADARFGDFIIGPAILGDDGSPIGSPVVLGLSDTKGRLSIVGLINFNGLVDGLFDLHVPDGLGLQISARYPTVKGKAESIAVLNRSSGTSLYSVKNKIMSAGVELVITWTFDDTFEGGPPTRLANLTIIGGIFSTIIISLFVGFLLRQNEVIRVRIEEATYVLAEKEGQLQMALDHMPGAMYVVDDELNLRLFNEQYKDIYGDSEGLVAVGNSIRDIVRAEVKSGIIGGTGSADDKLAERIRSYRSGEQHIFEDRAPDGRHVQLIRTPAPGNYTVSVATDVTDSKLAAEKQQRSLEELERFNRLAVNRELRMIELKRKINALQEQQGKAPQYKIVG